MTSYLLSDNICTSENIIYHIFWAIINCKNAKMWLEMVEKFNGGHYRLKTF